MGKAGKEWRAGWEMDGRERLGEEQHKYMPTFVRVHDRHDQRHGAYTKYNVPADDHFEPRLRIHRPMETPDDLGLMAPLLQPLHPESQRFSRQIDSRSVFQTQLQPGTDSQTICALISMSAFKTLISDGAFQSIPHISHISMRGIVFMCCCIVCFDNSGIFLGVRFLQA